MQVSRAEYDVKVGKAHPPDFLLKSYREACLVLGIVRETTREGQARSQ